MKVSIDGILNTAIDMKNQKNVQQESLKSDRQKVKTDSIQIRSRLASRLGVIQKELKVLQNSLTRNQTIKEGIDQLIQDHENQGNRADMILEQVRFGKENILIDFLGKDAGYEEILDGNKRIDQLMAKDIRDLKALQIEIENIAASTITDSDIEKRISDIGLLLSKIDSYTLSDISNLTPDMVVELID